MNTHEVLSLLFLTVEILSLLSSYSCLQHCPASPLCSTLLCCSFFLLLTFFVGIYFSTLPSHSLSPYLSHIHVCTLTQRYPQYILLFHLCLTSLCFHKWLSGSNILPQFSLPPWHIYLFSSVAISFPSLLFFPLTINVYLSYLT